MDYKTALIHKFPQAVARVILEDLSDIDLSTLTLGDILQRIEISITDLCYYRKARKEIVEATKFTKGKAFCQDSFYTTNYGCSEIYKHCSCSKKKSKPKYHNSKRHAKRKQKAHKWYFRRRVHQVNQQDINYFIYGKKGHFAKNCPIRDKNKIFNQVHIQLDCSEVSSNHSLYSSHVSVMTEQFSTAISKSNFEKEALQYFDANAYDEFTQLATTYNKLNIQLLLQLVTDVISIAIPTLLLITGRKRLAILNSWIQESFYNDKSHHQYDERSSKRLSRWLSRRTL